MTNDHLSDKVADGLLYIIAFSIPWAKAALPLLFMLWGGALLWRYAGQRRIYRPACATPIWASVITYLILLAYAMFGFANERASEILEIKLSYIAVPIMAFLIKPITTIQLERVYKWFVLGCFVFDVIAITHASILFNSTGDPANLYYQGLSWYIHPSYQGLYHCFAIYLLARSVFSTPMFAGSHVISFLLIIIYSMMLAALASKAGIICLGALGLGFMWYSVVKKRAMKFIMPLTLAVVMAIFLINTILAGVASRMTEASKDVGAWVNSGSEEVMQTTAYSSVTLRLVAWTSAFQVLLSNPFGVGTGRASNFLDDYYISHQQPYAASHHLNAHQQFLQHGLDLGWMGILLLIITFLSLARHLLRVGNYAGLVFCFLCAVNFMLESMLETQAGIIFFFFWLMIYCKEQHEVKVLQQ